jgi:hypothetical protein
MTRNQKIALGCGGAGCLGLIVVAIAGCLIYFFSYRRPPRRYLTSNYNFNVNNANRSYNYNSNSNDNENENSNSSSSSTSANSMSDDDKHKLYQAAAMTGDAELIQRVSVAIGLLNEDYTPGEKYQKFVYEHVEWGARNADFINSINTPEKARAYVNEHFPD